MRLPASIFLRTMLIATLGIANSVQAAQGAPAEYPNKTIRFITGFLPGGVSDTIARVLAEKLGERLGQRVIIDGRPGAGGLISMELTAGASPDGYTWFLGTPVVTISPSFKRKLPFDPAKVLAPVTLIGTSPTILVAAASLPAAMPGRSVVRSVDFTEHHSYNSLRCRTAEAVRSARPPKLIRSARAICFE